MRHVNEHRQLEKTLASLGDWGLHGATAGAASSGAAGDAPHSVYSPAKARSGGDESDEDHGGGSPVDAQGDIQVAYEDEEKTARSTAIVLGLIM